MWQQQQQQQAFGIVGCAVSAYCLIGVLDRPWIRRYLRVSYWTPGALVACVLYRLGGGKREVVLLPRVEQRVVVDVLKILMVSTLVQWAVRLRRLTLSDVKSWAQQAAIEAATWAAPGRVREEFEKVEKDLKKSLRKGEKSGLVRLPEEPLASREKLVEDLETWSDVEDDKWRNGLVSGAVYHGEAEHLELLNAASAAYCVANPLHPDIWPTVNRMESEVISMTARLVDGGDEGVCGAMTSGGTESIIMAVKAHRDKFAKERGLAKGGQVVACTTAHAAVDKACDLLGLELVKVPPDPETYRIDLGRLRRAMTADTILIYASAPSFPQGVVDDVEGASRIARAAGVGCHVDCCLGGYILPFLDRPDVKFDFGLPGVTSMSVDTHKYGYSVKGSSVVLYRSPRLRQYMYFCFPDWTGGLYATPTIPGSRSGSVIAATWASLVSIGRKGFRERATQIVETANNISTSLKKEIPQLELLGADKDGKVPAMIVCFASSEDGLNVYDVNDAMVRRGWSLNALQNPPCLHLCCTVRTVGHEDRFLSDLKESVEDAKKNNSSSSSSSAAIYGMASSMPAGPVSQVMRIYTDIQLSVPTDDE